MNPPPPAPADGEGSPPESSTRSVVVVTDTTTYLPAEMLERLKVRTISLYVGWDGEMRREEDYDDLDAFYARLRDSSGLPTTSQPSVGDFEELYGPLLEAGHDVASIHIASGLSGTCESAREAARKMEDRGHPGRVEVIDGATGAGGLGCLVLAAATAASGGAGLDAVAETVASTHERLDIWFCLDTLEYLRRGGRIGAAQALVGTALRIKPILTFGTEITPVGRVRTRSRARIRMEACLTELRERAATDWIVQHAQSHDDATWLVERGREIIGTEPLFCTQVGPVLGAHLGSGMLVGGISAGETAGSILD